MPKEIETKFMIFSPSELRKKIRSLGAEYICRKREKDIYYGIDGARIPGLVIRLRDLGGNRGIFTIKLPPAKQDRSKFKVRDEYQIGINNAGRYKRALEKTGFKRLFRKEKIRETYKMRGVELLLDNLPHIGWYLEIEGAKKGIARTARRLGLDMDNALSCTYMDIFEEYKKKAKESRLEMVFTR